MKTKSLFKSVAAAMLLATMSLTSCVQDDLYDDFIDDDMSSESMIARRKFKGDSKAEKFVAGDKYGDDECVAVAICKFSGKTIQEVRAIIGRGIYGDDWVEKYYKAVQKEGGLNLYTSGAVEYIKNICGVEKTTNTLQRDRDASTQSTAIYVPTTKTIVQLDHCHWGILVKQVVSNGTITTYIDDNIRNNDKFEDSQITYWLHK